MSVINVTSEIGKLNKVLVHRPGRELLNLTPDTLEELLFDDIPFLEQAQAEHDGFCDVMRENGTEVVYLEDLMAETLDQNDGLKEEFLKQFIDEANVKDENIRQELYDYLIDIEDNKEFVLKTMEGVAIKELDHNADSLADRTGYGSHLAMNPMPNLYFTRDPFASVGNGVVLNRMYAPTRNRETIYASYIFNHHEEYKDNIELLYDRDNPYHIEGGDILNINEKTLAIGISQRTQAQAIEVLAKNLFFHSSSKVEKVLAFDLPVKRAFMHLDTVFTQIDVDKFTIHPGILGTLRVFELTKGEGEDELNVKETEDTLENVLSEAVGQKVTLIQCGGGDPIIAAREQWNDGSNTLAIAPGEIIVYERNLVTNGLLEEAGIDVNKIKGAELVRGRGGPRCMSMSLVREEI